MSKNDSESLQNGGQLSMVCVDVVVDAKRTQDVHDAKPNIQGFNG